jgi:predicted dehydrogenase
MALDLTPEQREIGQQNYYRVAGQLREGVTRRDFIKGAVAAGAAAPVAAAAYFGYRSESSLHGGPVKTALIGAGDEGGILVTEHNPKYLEFVAFCDIRPSNQERIFTGDKRGPRKGFEGLSAYGREARQKIRRFESYDELLGDKSLGIEAVVIALPLHLHAPAAIAAMKAGKHVLCEKLMAWNISQCKEMIRVADETDRVLAIGHQRHYSLLYAHAVEILQAGILGDVKHVRALWHRNNALPNRDGEGKDIPGTVHDSWHPEIAAEDRKALESKVRQLGYKSVEELCRWRLYQRTGAGLMAELGSHQLDACSIFLSAMRAKPGEAEAATDLRSKVQPLAVTGVGGKYFYHDDREIDDHIFVTYEFPGPHYETDKNDIVVVTYSSINTNSFEPYGECVMGTRGTMIVESERDILLYPERGAAGAGRSVAVTVTTSASGQPVLDSSASTGPAERQAADAGEKALGTGPVSRGYREEMEHFAYCVRMWGQGMSKKDRPLPRCHGRVAMGDAIIALTANQAMRKQQRLEFNPAWFVAESAEVPDADMKADPFLQA